MPATVRAFIRLSRLKFLAGGFLAFALGASAAIFAGAPLVLGAYALGQFTVSSFHLMVHYANDYFDRFCDADAQRTAWSGGSGALVEGTLAPSVALVAALTCAAAGTIGVALLAAAGNWRAAAVCAAAGVLAWAYSAPPLRLLARGLGELDTAAIVAVLFPLAGYFALTPAPALRVVVSALPSASAMLALMLCVEYPDVEVDRLGGKMNLVARLGRKRARALVVAAVAAIYGCGVAAIACGAPVDLAYFLALTLPVSWGLCARLRSANLDAVAPSAEIAGRGVALFVVTVLGSTLAYLAAL